jgi:hypothetical protein
LQALIAQIPTTLSTNPTPDLNRYVLQNWNVQKIYKCK